MIILLHLQLNFVPVILCEVLKRYKLPATLFTYYVVPFAIDLKAKGARHTNVLSLSPE
jgi:hypothetical protein